MLLLTVKVSHLRSRYIENCDKWWELLGSGYAEPYDRADDPRFEEMLEVVDWFATWKEDIDQLSGSTTAKGRAKMFVSRQTWWALVRDRFR